MTVIAGITSAMVCGGAAGAWALTRGHGAKVPMYASAREMAQRAGCAPTFRSLPAPSGVQSAGECRLLGQLVDLRVQRIINTANPWPMAHGARRSPNFVGNGWIVHSDDVRTLDIVGARLAP